MGTPIHRAISWLWPEGATASAVLLAAVLVVLKGAGLENHPWVEKAAGILSPLFIIVVLIQLYLIRSKKIEQHFSHETFQTGDEFDDYLNSRLNRAKEIRVIHISSGTSKDRNYPSIIESFIKKGKSFSRIFSDSANPDVVAWIWNDLKKYKDSNHNFFIYCLKDIRVEKETRTMGIMLIDDTEVCLGGGYHMKRTQPTVCFRDPAVVEFFSDYYDQLERQAKGIRIPGRSVNWELMKSLFPEWKDIGLTTD